MELTLDTKRLVTASAAVDGPADTYELVQDGAVVDTLAGDAVSSGRVAFAEREVAAGAKLKIRAHVTVETDEQTVA
jgi:hypothetical protein